MRKEDKDPPLLKGFSSRGGSKGKPLTSPSTSLWLAIIFVALLFALGSVQRTSNQVETIQQDDKVRRSPWIVDAPETFLEQEPPPNPASLSRADQELPALAIEDIELETEAEKIEIQPIDLELVLEIPTDIQSPD